MQFSWNSLAASIIALNRASDKVLFKASLTIANAPKSLQMVIAAMKLNDAYSLEGKLWRT